MRCIWNVVFILALLVSASGYAHHGTVFLRGTSVGNAVHAGNTGLLAELVASGNLDLNDAGHGDGTTPLMWALSRLRYHSRHDDQMETRENIADVIKFYINHPDADLHVADESGLTALDYALRWTREDDRIVELLQKRRGYIFSAEHNLGTRLDILNAKNMSDLHKAVSSRDENAVQYFLDNGADINLVSDIGTPLDIAVQNKDVPMIIKLLKNGAKGKLYPDGYIETSVSDPSNSKANEATDKKEEVPEKQMIVKKKITTKETH